MQRRVRLPLLACVTLAALVAPDLAAANLVVENLELVSYGAYDKTTGRFPISSRLAFDLGIGGGEKFAGLLRLDFLSTQVESDLRDLQQSLSYADALQWTLAERTALISRINAPGLRLKTVSVSAKRILGLPLEASYFVGYLDTFCSRDDFATLFGATPFATELRGPLRYPNGIKLNPVVSWDGIHAVYGTGARFGLSLGDRSKVYTYAYQDSDLGSGTWSGDLRGLFDLNTLKIETFAGGSWDVSHKYGLYRGGLLFHVAPGDMGEFYAQVGVPQYDPTKAFDVNDVYFLFEPRVNFVGGGGQLALTVFYHPAYYRQKATGEGGSLDVGFNLRFGRLSDSGMQGGFEAYLQFRPKESQPLAAEVSPYYEAILSGVAWNFKLGLALFPFPTPWFGIFKPFIGVKTSY